MTVKTNPTNVEDIKKTENPSTEVKAEAKTEKVVEAPAETQEQINWRKFREIRDKERKEKEELERKSKSQEAEVSALKQALEAVLNKPATVQVQASTEEISPEDDEIQRKVDEAMKKREAKNDQERREREKKEEPVKLKQTFPDFEKVCSQENVDYLEYHHPEAFEALKSMPDSFDKWTKVYNAMKRYIPNVDAAKEAAKAERNLKKPQSISSGLAQTGDTSPILPLTEERKKDTWARMQRRMRGLE